MLNTETVNVVFGRANGTCYEVLINWLDGSPFQVFRRAMTPMITYTPAIQYPISRIGEIYEFIHKMTANTHNPIYLDCVYKQGRAIANREVVRIEHKKYFRLNNQLICMDDNIILTLDLELYYEVTGNLAERKIFQEGI